MNSNAALALAALALCAAARADTLPVAPGDDLAAAITAAAPGDTLLFAPGRYDAPLLVPFGKNGLILRAKGDVVLDARPGGAAVGPAVVVQSDEVTLQGFTIQHAQAPDSAEGIKADDDGSLSGVDGLVVRDCRILNCDGPALLSVGNGTVVENCFIAGCEGLSITGDDARVEKTTLRDSEGVGLVIAGNDAVVSKLTLANTAGTGIDVSGERATVGNCRLNGCDLGIQVNGPDFAVLKNTVVGCPSGGLVVGTGTILGRVEANRISDCADRGILVLDVNNLVVRKNVVERCGRSHDPGLHLVAFGALVESNIIRDGDGDGFFVVGDENLLRKNKSIGNLGDGFRMVTGDGNRFEACTALGNHGEGFQNDDAGNPGNVTNTQLAGCKAKGNRRDVAVITEFSELGVTFTTGGNDPGLAEHQPEIEDT